MDWKNIVGESWYSLLSSFLEGDKMNHIITSIQEARKKGIVYPEKNEFYKMFRIFKELQPDDIKVIMLAQDPYPDGSGTGYAFDNGDTLPGNMNPSLKNILHAIEQSDTDKVDFTLVYADLERWVKQGVFLVNSYLTVPKGNPGKHKFWDPFTKFWIEALSAHRSDLIFLLMGNFAQSYEDYIQNTDQGENYIIRTSHPSPLGFTKTTKKAKAFKGSGCFEEINNHLWVLEKETIKW